MKNTNIRRHFVRLLPFIFLAASSCVQSSAPGFDPKLLVGEWRLVATETAGKTETDLTVYKYHIFSADGKYTFTDYKPVGYRVEGRRVIFTLPDGDAKVYDEIVAIDSDRMVMIDSKYPNTKETYENVTPFKAKIIGRWKLIDQVRNGKRLHAPQTDRVLIFTADGKYTSREEGKTYGPFPYRISGGLILTIFTDETPAKECIRSLNDSQLQIELFWGNHNNHWLYERINPEK